jgi:ribonuclease HII
MQKKLSRVNLKIRFLIGIDEVGRGPVAGPVTLCAFLIPLRPLKPLIPLRPPKPFRNKSVSELEYRKTLAHFRGVKDSKQLTADQREEWYARILAHRVSGRVDFALTSISPALIDSRGLSWAINTALKRCLTKLSKLHDFDPDECRILLDGSLKAPAEFIYQKTIIKGDEKEPVIALASIAAKVTRDRHMIRLAKIYPTYGFEVHKGYGTSSHYLKISAQGMCPLHRRSFLKNFSLK